MEAHSASCRHIPHRHAIAQLCVNNRTNQDAVAGLEGLPPLVSMVSSGSSPPDVQMHSARALAELRCHAERDLCLRLVLCLLLSAALSQVVELGSARSLPGNATSGADPRLPQLR